MSVNGRRYEKNQLLFADDTTQAVDSEEKLCWLVPDFRRVCERRKLRVNVGKSLHNVAPRSSYEVIEVCKWGSNARETKDKRISKDKSPSVWFLFCDVILDLSKYKHNELVFNSCYKHALRCVMTMMVLNSYLH